MQITIQLNLIFLKCMTFLSISKRNFRTNDCERARMKIKYILQSNNSLVLPFLVAVSFAVAS